MRCDTVLRCWWGGEEAGVAGELVVDGVNVEGAEETGEPPSGRGWRAVVFRGEVGDRVVGGAGPDFPLVVW